MCSGRARDKSYKNSVDSETGELQHDWRAHTQDLNPKVL